MSVPYSVYGGFTPQPGRWGSGVRRGGVNAPALEMAIDNALPNLGQDLQLPGRNYVTIPRGRFVALQNTDLTRQFNTSVLTLANGVDPLNGPSFATGNVPVGYAAFNMYRDFSGLPADKPVFARHELIELPYTAVNESQCLAANGGTHLQVGEYVMPYYGSATSPTATIPQDRGSRSAGSRRSSSPRHLPLRAACS